MTGFTEQLRSNISMQLHIHTLVQKLHLFIYLTFKEDAFRLKNLARTLPIVYGNEQVQVTTVSMLWYRMVLCDGTPLQHNRLYPILTQKRSQRTCCTPVLLEQSRLLNALPIPWYQQRVWHLIPPFRMAFQSLFQSVISSGRKTMDRGNGHYLFPFDRVIFKLAVAL